MYNAFADKDENPELPGSDWDYTFNEQNARPDDPVGRGTTTVTVDLDTTEDFLDYMNETYPKALDKLKEICEK